MKEIEKKIMYSFRNTHLLTMALTHSSYHNEHKTYEHNERMEFLGDAVLSLVVRDYLYKTYPNEREGVLSRYASSVVCEAYLSAIAKTLTLDSYVYLGKGCVSTPAILSDTLEALIGALYIDGGYKTAQSFILEYILSGIDSIITNNQFIDPKTRLNEFLQQKDMLPVYDTKEKTSERDMFVSLIYVEGKAYGTGEGVSKREAEQHAAEKTLQMLL